MQKKIKIKYEIFQKSDDFFFEICYNVVDVILRGYNSSFFNTFCRIMQKINGRLFKYDFKMVKAGCGIVGAVYDDRACGLQQRN